MDKYNHLKIKLEEERGRLEGELKDFSKKDPHKEGQRQVKAPEFDIHFSDKNEIADAFEEMDAKMGIDYQLNERLKEVNFALGRMAEGKYGTCVKCGKLIEDRRLEANPAAVTCVEHAI